MSSISSPEHIMNTICNNNIENSSKYSEFIFFGCWNNINCKSEYIYRDIVLDYISNNEKDIKQLYIAGDNWYTNKKKINDNEYKLYIPDILHTGYDKLYRMNKEIYIAVGNHDVDRDNDKDELKKDCSINTQKYYLKKIKEAANGMIDIPTLEDLKMIQNTELNEEKLCEKGVYIYVDNIGVRYNKNNIVIIINTNIFDNLEEGNKYLKKIKSVIKQVIKAQAIKGSSSGSTCTKQIFVMGHIPLFTYKKDDISIHDINKEDYRYRILIIDLFDILLENNIIYLCADTHNFSIMKIKHNDKTLIQITAGTGGADPDLIKGDFSLKPYRKDIEDYSIEAYALNPYGYVSINIEGIYDAKYIDVCYTQVIIDKNDLRNKEKSIMKLRPSSAPLINIDNRYNKLAIPNASASISTSRIIKNKINKLTYRITITKDTTTVKHFSIKYDIFENNIKYHNKSICNKIKSSNPDGSIKNAKGDIYCYKKLVKKDKKKSTI